MKKISMKNEEKISTTHKVRDKQQTPIKGDTNVGIMIQKTFKAAMITML